MGLERDNDNQFRIVFNQSSPEHIGKLIQWMTRRMADLLQDDTLEKHREMAQTLFSFYGMSETETAFGERRWAHLLRSSKTMQRCMKEQDTDTILLIVSELKRIFTDDNVILVMQVLTET